MRIPYLLVAMTLGIAPAAAQPHGVCIDPHYGYQARFLAGQDIVAKATIGRDRREIKLSTTCIFLSTADHIALSTDFACVGQGDDVETSTIDGRHQSCRITHAELYAPEHG